MVVAELLGTDEQSAEELWGDVFFRMVYVNEKWTTAQYAVRAVFSVLSAIVILIFNSRILCGIHHQHSS